MILLEFCVPDEIGYFVRENFYRLEDYLKMIVPIEQVGPAISAWLDIPLDLKHGANYGDGHGN
jgi:hypothetical protein